MGTLHSETLFRQQAINALSRRPFGEPISVMPKPWSWLTGFVVVFAVIAAGFLATAEYSRKESVRGWLVASEGVARITHGRAATVDSVAMAPGTLLKAGDPVIYLSRDTFLEDGRNSGDEMVLELRKQLTAIDQRAQLLRAEAEIEKSSIASQLQDLEREQQSLSHQRGEQKRRLDAASNKLRRLKSAAGTGAVADWDVLREEDEQRVLKQTWSRMQQNEIELDRERERLTARAKSLPVEVERLISNLNSQRSQLQQQITRQEAEQRIVLKSPISGKLASVEVHAGSAVAPNQLLATVIPEKLDLVAEIYVPTSAVGFISPGQDVRLMYDAFPQQQFGAFAGVVDRISDFILLPTEVPQTFFPREATFKIQIAIKNRSIALETGDALLRPGMLLAAEIILESRRLLDWLLEPVRLRRRGTS